MTDLLTTKEVQDLLRVDRTTIYRMLNDGRLTGIKIGQQWRFARPEVEALLAGRPPAEPARRNGSAQALPLHCVQLIQDVFAEVAEVGAVTAGPDGEPLTGMSHSCAFCTLIQSSPTGRAGCVASWRRLAAQPEAHPQFATCHAGLQYARARIELDGELAALIIAGQYYTAPPAPDEEAARVRRLAAAYDLDPAALAAAAAALPVLDERKRARMAAWLEQVAHTFEDISHERLALMGRLRQIAAMSTIES